MNEPKLLYQKADVIVRALIDPKGVLQIEKLKRKVVDGPFETIIFRMGPTTALKLSDFLEENHEEIKSNFHKNCSKGIEDEA